MTSYQEEKLDRLLEAVASCATNVANVTNTLNRHVEDAEKRHDELEKRVRTGETKVTRLTTIGMTLQAVFTAGVALFGLSKS